MRAPAFGTSWDEMRYRLVSLWWLFMDRFHVERFLRAYNSITNLGQTIISFRATNPDMGMAFSGRDYQEFCTHFKTISEELDAI